MSRKFAALAAAAAVSVVLAQTPDPNAGLVPLTSKHFDYNNLPQVASPNAGERGPQSGINNCGPATEGQNSQCQTGILNSVDDFCLWGGPMPGSVVGNTEAASVAWCSKPGHGARTMPPGTLTGVQFIQTPDYLQVTGFLKQEYINYDPNDSGGEMDPHGADEQGNPLGGLMFTNGFPASGGDKTKYVQAIEWHNFMGGNQFCFKICDPAGPNAAKLCDHIYDRIGCAYNAPAAYVDGVFESCKGDSQLPPGTYVVNGVTSVYQQPPESLGPINSMPYVAAIPATSQCVQYKSADLYAAANTVPVPSGLSTKTTATSAKPTTAKPTSTGTAKPTSTSGAASRVSGGYAAGLIGALAAFVAAL